MTQQELSDHLAFLAGVAARQRETQRALSKVFREPVPAYRLGAPRCGAPKDEPRTVGEQ